MGERSTEGAGGQKYMQEMMERIEKSNAGQEKYARRQYRMSQITAAASLLILAAVWKLPVAPVRTGSYPDRRI